MKSNTTALFHVKYTKPLSAFSCVLSECSPKEQKISVRYTLYRIAQLYEHICPEAAFINIKLCKTRERYDQICEQVLKEI